MSSSVPPVKEEFRRFVHRLARESGQVLERYFLASDLEVATKEDGTLVTPADREAEEVMRRLIRKEYPAHGILGEEGGAENETAEFVWVLDPIDGTVSFVHGSPLFGTLIGLLQEGEPILGVIHQPVLKLLCFGENHRTTLNGAPVQMRTRDRLAQATVLTTDVGSVSRYQSKSGFENLVERAGLFRTWGDCYGYLLLASGRADIMLDPVMAPWDVLPLIPIIQGAQGVITAWDGGSAARGNSCVAANKKLHPLVLEILNG